MFRKTLRAASAAADADAHYFSSVASPPNAKLSPLYTRPPKPTPFKSKNSSSYAENSHDEPKIRDSKARLREFLQKNCKPGDLSADEAFGLFHSMAQMEPRFPLYSFNLLLNGLAKKKRCSDVLSLYGKMNSAGLTPNFISLKILLNCLCNAHRVCDAFLVMGRILRLGYSPTVRTFNALIKSLCIGSSVYDAVLLFSKLDKFGCRPNLIIYNALKRELLRVGGNGIYGGKRRPKVVKDSCDNGNNSLCKKRNEDKAMELSNIDTPIWDINNSRPNSRLDPWLWLLSCLLSYRLVKDNKGQEELKSNNLSNNIYLAWKAQRDQLNRDQPSKINSTMK